MVKYDFQRNVMCVQHKSETSWGIQKMLFCLRNTWQSLICCFQPGKRGRGGVPGAPWKGNVPCPVTVKGALLLLSQVMKPHCCHLLSCPLCAGQGLSLVTVSQNCHLQRCQWQDCGELFSVMTKGPSGAELMGTEPPVTAPELGNKHCHCGKEPE